MSTLVACLALLLFGHVVNLFFITVLYHRGLAHGAVELGPRTRRWVVMLGPWLTGIDPKAWACMHRLHHKYSDTEQDPHSPVNLGVLGVLTGQLRSYERALVGLSRGDPHFLEMVKDFDFPVHWLNRKKVWWLPYVLHLVVAAGVGMLWGGWEVGAAYWLGIMSHPVHGWMVNALAHRFGYRNHALPDQSTNNTVVAWLLMGEGFQNNHHAHPRSAKFSERWFEVDAGYALCWVAEKLGWIRILPAPVQDS